VITIFGTTYFTIGAGLIVLALAAPLLLWFAFWLLRPNIEGKPRSTRWLAVGGTTMALLLVTAVGLFWDVYLIGQRAKELCRDAGISISRIDVASGFLGDIDIEYWAAYGFDFVEHQLRNNLLRYTLVAGQVMADPVKSPASRHQLARESALPNLGATYVDRKFRRTTSSVVELQTNETLGRLTEYSISPGWIDQTYISLTGFTFIPWRCSRSPQGDVEFSHSGPRYTERDLVRAVLLPPP